MSKIKEGIRISIISIIINALLSLIKLIAGIIGKSSAMISDSVHSISDVVSTIIVIIGFKISNKEADIEHPYGHERLESIAAITLSIMLFLTGILIGFQGIKNIFLLNNTIKPNAIALIAAILSIAIKEIMYLYTIKYAKKIKSDALKADAWHHRSDALSSVGSLIGIAGSMLGFLALDSIASVIISFFVIKVAYEIFIESITKIDDHSCDNDTIEKIKKATLSTDGVLKIDSMKTRLFGNKIYVDLEISADKNISFEQAHEIAHNVHDKIESEIKDVKHCMVHINPR